jgi:hypothetical protein
LPPLSGTSRSDGFETVVFKIRIIHDPVPDTPHDVKRLALCRCCKPPSALLLLLSSKSNRSLRILPTLGAFLAKLDHCVAPVNFGGLESYCCGDDICNNVNPNADMSSDALRVLDPGLSWMLARCNRRPYVIASGFKGTYELLHEAGASSDAWHFKNCKTTNTICWLS